MRINILFYFAVIGTNQFLAHAYGGEHVSAVQEKAQKSKTESPDIKTILKWLPADSETLIVTKGPFEIREPNEEDTDKNHRLSTILESLSYGPLATPAKGAFTKPLAGQKLELAVEGARNYRPPMSLGMSMYEGCHVLVFRNDLGDAGEALRKLFAKRAAKVESVDRHNVYCFEEKLEEDLWKFFFAHPKKNILLCATDLKYMTETLQRMSQNAKDRAFPDDLPEWKHVDTTAPFWAIRHFGKRRKQDFAESPRVVDPDGVGVTFSHQPAKTGEKEFVKLAYLSTSKNAEKIATSAWTYYEKPAWRPIVRNNAGGVIRMTAEFEQDRAREFLWLWLFSFGHGIAL